VDRAYVWKGSAAVSGAGAGRARWCAKPNRVAIGRFPSRPHGFMVCPPAGRISGSCVPVVTVGGSHEQRGTLAGRVAASSPILRVSSAGPRRSARAGWAVRVVSGAARRP